VRLRCDAAVPCVRLALQRRPPRTSRCARARAAQRARSTPSATGQTSREAPPVVHKSKTDAADQETDDDDDEHVRGMEQRARASGAYKGTFSAPVAWPPAKVSGSRTSSRRAAGGASAASGPGSDIRGAVAAAAALGARLRTPAARSAVCTAFQVRRPLNLESANACEHTQVQVCERRMRCADTSSTARDATRLHLLLPLALHRLLEVEVIPKGAASAPGTAQHSAQQPPSTPSLWLGSAFAHAAARHGRSASRVTSARPPDRRAPELVPRVLRRHTVAPDVVQAWPRGRERVAAPCAPTPTSAHTRPAAAHVHVKKARTVHVRLVARRVRRLARLRSRHGVRSARRGADAAAARAQRDARDAAAQLRDTRLAARALHSCL
jgi:hypothetical protein